MVSYAQEPIQTIDPTADEEDVLVMDTITTTGSRIRRSNATSAIPLQVFGGGEIAEIGTVDVGEILREIPGVDASLSPESTALSTQNSGLSTINLRRLGGNRTLTLIDGRRAISNSGNGERVSLNTIPAGFIERVEVTTGGASAIYGSDAIAGVANIILKSDWQGLEFNTRVSTAEASGEDEFGFDATWGGVFADGRGYLLASIDYFDESAIYADDTRPLSVLPIEWTAPTDIGNFNDETQRPGCDGSGRFCFNPSLTSALPGGIFEGDDAWNIGGVWFNDRSLLPDDGRTPRDAFETNVDGYNFRPGRTLSPSTERFAAAIKTDYRLTGSVEAFAELFYSSLKSRSANAPRAANVGTDIGNSALVADDPSLIFQDIGLISPFNPFVPPEVEETRLGGISWNRMFVEVGRNDRANERETFRSAFGLRGDIWGDWNWDLYATYGRFEQSQDYINELNYLRIQQGLRVESDGAGGYQCIDPDARAAGCVPLNIFGEGSITPEAADWIRYSGHLAQEREQVTFAGTMNGDLYELPAGTVKAAFGFEYRREEQDTVGDPDNTFEYTSVTPIPNIRADFDVTEVFAELDIPLHETLSMQLAARAADYSTVGNVLSYNVGGVWSPTEDIRFRAQYSRSQRAPTLTEFFSPPRGDFDGLDDPCDGLLPDGSGVDSPRGSSADPAQIAANCLTEPGIQAFFADPDNAGNAFEFNGGVSGPNAGNQELFEETADTITFGVVLTPRFLPNLTLIVDYYDINVEDAIGSVSTQLTADLCYTSADFPNNRFCDVITRDTSTGRVAQVINRQENLNEIAVEGIDATLDYSWELGGIPGEFDLNLRYAHYLSETFTFQAINGLQTEDQLGEINNPENEYRAVLGWDHEGWRTAWTARYRQGGVDDLDVPSDAPAFFEVDGETFHNLYVRYVFRDNPSVSIYGGVNNVFDEFGPLVPNRLSNGNSRNIVSSLNDVEGREFYAGVRLRW